MAFAIARCAMATITLPHPGHPLVLVESTERGKLQEIDRGDLIALYKSHGAILFRGFDADLSHFRAFAQQFCSSAVVNESPGRTPLDRDATIYSVDGGTNAFPLHPELSREPWKPDLAMFGCLAAPGAGGQTTLCDGIALARALPAKVREGLSGRRLIYIAATWPDLLAYWLGTATPSDEELLHPPSSCPYEFNRLPDGQIIRHFSRPALHRPMFAEGPAFGNFLLFARFNNGRTDFPLLDDLSRVPDDWMQAIKAAADGLTLAVSWQAGDVLMLDNTRFMHGRTAILDPAARQIASYFGYLNFAEPDPEEIADPIWRREPFQPPRPPPQLLQRGR